MCICVVYIYVYLLIYVQAHTVDVSYWDLWLNPKSWFQAGLASQILEGSSVSNATHTGSYMGFKDLNSAPHCVQQALCPLRMQFNSQHTV